jgi:hypothetical protein
VCDIIGLYLDLFFSFVSFVIIVLYSSSYNC